MVSSDFRAEARKKLEGKWGKVACITLIYMLIFFVISFIENKFDNSMSSLISLIVTIIEIPLGFGIIFALFKIFHNEEIGTFDFLNLGFSNFKRSWAVSLNIVLKMIIPIILIIVSSILTTFGIAGLISASILYSTSSVGLFGLLTTLGVIILIVSMIWATIKSYYYQLSYLVAIDNPDLTAKEVVEKSANIINGKRWKLFCLQFSFIGWAILSVVTLGIGFIFLLPYVHFAIVAFYKSLIDNTNIEAEIVKENNDNPIQGE